MSDSQDPLAAITSFLEEHKLGDVMLVLKPSSASHEPSDQPLKLLEHSLILSLASSVLAGAVESQHGGTLEVGERAWAGAWPRSCVRPLRLMPSSLVVMQVDGSHEAWAGILTRIYPMYPRPKLTLTSVFSMLPVAHKYVEGQGSRRSVQTPAHIPHSSPPSNLHSQVRFQHHLKRDLHVPP